MKDALNLALDRFEVPPLSAGRTDRIMAAATGTSAVATTAAPEPRRRFDRRGAWRRGRQVVIGGLAAGMLSAAAVASGLLGSVGIEVPVLTAMLAPKPKPVVKPKPVSRPVVQQARAQAPAAPVVPAPVMAGPLAPAERMELRQERRERRQAFAAEHPVIAARIKERMRERLRERAMARRAALVGPAIDAPRGLSPAERLGLARAARRDRIVAERMIDRRLEQREMRRDRIDALPLEGRATLRERLQERRAQRLERLRATPSQ